MDGACLATKRAPRRYQPRRASQSVFYRRVQKHFALAGTHPRRGRRWREFAVQKVGSAGRSAQIGGASDAGRHLRARRSRDRAPARGSCRRASSLQAAFLSRWHLVARGGILLL